MKKNRTLRQMVELITLLAFLIPMTVFTLLSQARVWQMIYRTREAEMRNEMRAAGMTLDLVLDKYMTILYDFCTDDDTIDLVRNINERQDEMDVNSNRLRRELSHIGNRNAGVEGITLVTRDGRRFFYDWGAASSVSSEWALDIQAPEFDKGTVYWGGDVSITRAGKQEYFLHVARKLVDYRDIDCEIGTVIMTINQQEIWNSITPGVGSNLYITDGNQIIASPIVDMIQKDISTVDMRDRWINSVANEKTGWMLYDYYSTKGYQRTIGSNTLVWGISTMVLVLIVSIILRNAMLPLLEKVKELTAAMLKMEVGDFTVQVEQNEELPMEIQQIVDGFNVMVIETGAMVEKVKQSTVEQKNAELSAMEAQIDPHFLYNTLDTINWKALEKEEYEISDMVGALADILRYSIRNPGETVSIAHELSWLEQYVMLQKEKLSQPLQVEIDVLEDLKSYRIHKLLLQPFLENAINHGFYGKKEPCFLKIRMRLAENQLHITIRDNGKVADPELLRRLNDRTTQWDGHLGINNVRKRLELYYGEDADIYFESSEGIGLTVHLFIRAERGEEGEQ
ncbi:MAG: histidine kinase [Eubacteriales bacterium]|nr:histidine kinase [Eubacteriales bacterium]